MLTLKELTWFYVINRPALALIQEAQKDVVRNLFEIDDAAARPGGRRELLPVPEREAVADDPPVSGSSVTSLRDRCRQYPLAPRSPRQLLTIGH